MSKTDKQKSIPAASIQLLGAQPAEFDLPITLEKLDGETLEFAIRAKTMRKSQWAAIRDERQRAILQSVKTPDDEDTATPFIDKALALLDTRGEAAMSKEAAARDAAAVLHFAVSWPAEQPLNAGTLIDLEDELPGSLETIIAAYNRAIYQGRLGN
ncbi:MAG: phage tail assembly chaperone [Acidovorax sp.]